MTHALNRSAGLTSTDYQELSVDGDARLSTTQNQERQTNSERSPSIVDLFRPVAKGMGRVDEVLVEMFQHEHPHLNELLRHGSVLSGKRMRPALLLLVADACEGITESHVVMAAAIEMIHTASLVHDDLLDEADTRRHVETVHRRWNQESSVLFGDYLFTQAFYLVGDRVGGRACGLLAEATNQVCEGELLQVANRGNYELTQDEYFKIIRSKTAALCRIATQMGATPSPSETVSKSGYGRSDSHKSIDAPRDRVEALAEYGDLLGQAFQIIDDILDIDGRESVVGKSLGRDLEMEKATLPFILSRDLASQSERQEILATLQAGDIPIGQVRQFVDKHEGIERARAVAASLLTRASDIAEKWTTGGAAGENLQKLCRFVLERRH